MSVGRALTVTSWVTMSSRPPSSLTPTGVPSMVTVTFDSMGSVSLISWKSTWVTTCLTLSSS